MNKAPLLSACLYGIFLNAALADPIGFVKTVTGDSSVLSAGHTLQAMAGSPLQLGDTLKTGANSSLGITLKDNTMMSFGSTTEFTLDEFVFAPSKGDLKLGGKMARGTLNYVSGAIAKLKPEAVTLRTPTGTIGVRGTHFVLKVE